MHDQLMYERECYFIMLMHIGVVFIFLSFFRSLAISFLSSFSLFVMFLPTVRNELAVNSSKQMISRVEDNYTFFFFFGFVVFNFLIFTGIVAYGEDSSREENSR